MSYFNNYSWRNVDPDMQYESIEEALMTCCCICGDRLEWTLKTEYDPKLDIAVIKGTSFSCGVKYSIVPEADTLCYKIIIYA